MLHTVEPTLADGWRAHGLQENGLRTHLSEAVQAKTEEGCDEERDTITELEPMEEESRPTR